MVKIMTMSNSMVMKLMMVVKDYNDVRLYADEADERAWQ